jgi:hypothetical protein
MTVVVFAFAFSSVLGNYAYADANLASGALSKTTLASAQDGYFSCGKIVNAANDFEAVFFD